MFDAYTASDDTDMAEYFDGSNSAVAKIKSLNGILRALTESSSAECVQR